MDRSEQLTALKRLRLAQGATPERFEYEAEGLMAHWGVRDGTVAVAYLKRAVQALPRKHSESLSVMFGFTYPKKTLELRREAYAQKIGKAMATVKRLEVDSLEALLDQLLADGRVEVDPAYVPPREDVERLLREYAPNINMDDFEYPAKPISFEDQDQLMVIIENANDDNPTPANRAKIDALKTGTAFNETLALMEELLALLRARYAEIDHLGDEARALRGPIIKAHETLISLFNLRPATVSE